MAELKINIGKPSDRQKLFLSDNHRYVGYGGARGGGKSWSIRVKAILLAYSYPGIVQTIVRKSYKELESNHIRLIRQMLPPGAYKYNDSKKELRFPNGSLIVFMYCDAPRDVERFQGTETDILYIDEATQFAEEVFDKIKTIVRGTNGYPKRVYLTCNPGGVGHTWVKRLFIDRQYREKEVPEDYSFIPAKVTDNHALMKSDPGYYDVLDALPDRLRRAWLEGSWEIVDGLYYDEWDAKIHVIDHYYPPEVGVNYYASFDYGLDMFAAYLYACDSHKHVTVIKEIYQSKVLVADAAKLLKAMIDGYRVKAVYAPPDLYNKSAQTGKSIANGFEEAGIYLTKASNDLETGCLYTKQLLKPEMSEDGTIRPHLTIVRSCTNLIRCLSTIMVDEKRLTVYAKDPHELTHAPDALRYFAVQWWRPGRDPIPADANARQWSKSMWEDYCRADMEGKKYLKSIWGKPNYNGG